MLMFTVARNMVLPIDFVKLPGVVAVYSVNVVAAVGSWKYFTMVVNGNVCCQLDCVVSGSVSSWKELLILGFSDQ